MRPIEEKTQERLSGVAPKDRVYIYNGEHIIKFLHQTIVNTSHFLKDDYTLEIRELSDKDFKGVKDGLRENNIPLIELYKLYCAYLIATNNDHPPETRFKFGLIIKRLRYFKNGWEFDVYRRGKNQVWHVAPVILRIHANDEMKIVQELPSEQHVEVKFDDIQSDQEEESLHEEQIHELVEVEVSNDQTEAVVTINQNEEIHQSTPEEIKEESQSIDPSITESVEESSVPSENKSESDEEEPIYEPVLTNF